jgi:hypothetical protein
MQVWEGKPTDEKMEANGESVTQKAEVSSDSLKESTLAEKNGDEHKLSENGSVAKTGEAPKGAKPVASECKIVADGVANGC